MPGTPNPLDGIEQLIVDGTNLLHAIRGRSSDQAVPPAATLVGRIRAVVPPEIRIELVFDGPPEPGGRNRRIASGMTVTYSGKMPADNLISRMVAERPGSWRGQAGSLSVESEVRARESILVVTDDIDLAAGLRRHGARTVPAAWLVGQLSRTRLMAPSVGRPKPPPSPPAEDIDRRGWRPGRGATTKKGNPKRGR